MSILQILEIILSVLVGSGVLVAGVGYAYGQFKQGKSQAVLDEGNNRLNTNTLLKEQIDALENKVNRQSQEIVNLTKKVELLTKEIEVRDKKFAEAILTLEGKNPELANFINSGLTYMMETKPVMEDLKLFLNKQVL